MKLTVVMADLYCRVVSFSPDNNFKFQVIVKPAGHLCIFCKVLPSQKKTDLGFQLNKK